MCPKPLRAEGGRAPEGSGNESDLQRGRASEAVASSLQFAGVGAYRGAEPAWSGEGRECAPTTWGVRGACPPRNEGQGDA